MEELRDIKPLLEIPDYSYFTFLALVVFLVSVVVILLFLLFRGVWTKRQKDMKKIYLERLKSVDWSNSKEAAYCVTRLGKILTRGEDRPTEIYLQTLKFLEAYKYRKDVPTVDEQTLTQYHLLVHVIDESL